MIDALASHPPVTVRAAVSLPRLRLLGYQETRPHLRLIRLPEAHVEPSPIPLDRAPSALDQGVRRDGWIAFKSEEIWGVPIPLEGAAFKVGKSFGCVASRNERAIWMTEGHASSEAPRPYVEYDGVARAVVDRIVLPAGGRLVADTERGLIFDHHGGGWSLWQRGANHGEAIDEHELAPPGAFLRLEAEPERYTLALRDGRLLPLGRAIEGRWSHHRSFSPDGRYLAADLDVSLSREPPSMADIVHGRAKYEPVPHRLALIDCETGQVTIADGEFDNFASEPVWSHDGEWVVFAAPFMSRGLWACCVAEARLQWIDLGRSAPVPRVNVSDLVAD